MSTESECHWELNVSSIKLPLILNYLVLYTHYMILLTLGQSVLPLPLTANIEFHGADPQPTELPGPVPSLMRYMNNILLIR